MHEYALEEVTCASYAIDDSANGVTLRADLHMEFDVCGFVLMRKSEYGYTIHCLRATPDVLPAHHNRQTHPLNTLGSSLKRIIRVGAGSGMETEIVNVAAKEFRRHPPQSQNSSARKRSQQASSMADDESYAQDLHSDPLFNKRNLPQAPNRTPSALQSALTPCLSEKGLQDLKEAMGMEDWDAVRAKAKKIGASKMIIQDLRREFVEQFCFRAIQCNAQYEGMDGRVRSLRDQFVTHNCPMDATGFINITVIRLKKYGKQKAEEGQDLSKS
ncbi:MAG: Adenylosuccinate synthetase [Geoglossum umbratile]|nr:MAG: Adenylosuccinate synthetase [Geoglossum umbratile]